MYHRFGMGDPRRLDAVSLARQLRYLKRHFNVVSLTDIVGHLQAGRPFEPNTVAVTVDDVYTDFSEYAYPVFRYYGVPVTIYVVSEFAGGGFWMWWDAIRHLLDNAAAAHYSVEVAGKNIEFSLSDQTSREMAWNMLAPPGVLLSPQQRDSYLLDLQYVLSEQLPPVPVADYMALDWDGLRILDPGIVEIAAHTRTHPALSQCDPGRIRDEVAGSKRVIEEILDREVRAFSYPNGERADVDERCISAVRAAGFDSAVMACGGLVSPGADPFVLPRLSPARAGGDFEGDVSGLAI